MEMCQSADCKLCDFMEGKKELETSFNRQVQQANKCKFGRQGVCCRLCANGPCRITPKSPRGVCGADADTIVARNFLRQVAAGAGCYLHVLETTAQNLKEIGEGKYATELKGLEMLDELAELLEVEAESPKQKAVEVADKVLADLYKPRFEKMELVDKLAYQPRLEEWNQLDIIPGGAKSEVFDAVVKTSTNLASDPVDMLMQVLNLGVATGLYGLHLTNLLNDVIVGEPEITQEEVGFKVVDQDYINIVVTGHQQSMIAHLQDALISEEAIKRAQKLGAKGFKIVGSTCVGQDLQARGSHYKQVFAGHAGNNFTSEALLATGGIDLVISEFNCTLPGLEEIAKDYQVKMLAIDDVAKKATADLIDFKPEEAEEITEEIINQALISYQQRRGQVEIDIPTEHGFDDVVAGVSERSLRGFLGGNYQPLLELIAEGKIKGVAAVVGCSNLEGEGHDIFTVEMTKELIKRDILVLSAGCTTGGLQNCGLVSPTAAEFAGDNLQAVCEELGIPPVLNFGPCLSIGRIEQVAVEIAKELEVDLPQLPVVLSAPQWLEEQALADGAFGLALGLPLHLATPPFVTGSEVIVETLTEKLPEITGGQLIIDGEVESTVNRLEDIINDRRVGLDLV
ncbi:anaerobic carbon-monoxide dehydrogenase catalytic subunit [Natroniella sulfidigena]|uniref:anaerobic carbon-monoxide dehydrogenase catalytic subunit n=1 Tax=Natroniella sulfidigena TaxID=723921 RepID=UPI00200B6DEE|nr:anaerobic carbon-monoxide dehydrogenase catalytic subunit [Natroniella sulfidigena]MCK8816698.1 anaerobic carbon-monoxide dehydrogenase catalytic subunit [Natroniella sulfidigena]